MEHRLGPREELPGLAPSLISQAPPVSQTPLLGCGATVGFRERSQSRVWHTGNIHDANKGC